MDWSVSLCSHTLLRTFSHLTLLPRSPASLVSLSCLFLTLNQAPSFPAFNYLFFLSSFLPCGRISTEHSPKLQIRSHSYLRAVSEVSINRSLDSLDPAGLLASPKFRSRNESYMRAMSTISQVSGTQGPVPFCRWPRTPCALTAMSNKVVQGEEIQSVAVSRPELTIGSPSGKVWTGQTCFLGTPIITGVFICFFCPSIYLEKQNDKKWLILALAS